MIGPFGLRAPMRIEVDASVPEELLTYHAVGLRLARWRLRFSAVDPANTRVDEQLDGPLGPPVSWLLAAVGKHPQREVTANLQRLKEVMETGSVHTLTATARGKFRSGSADRG